MITGEESYWRVEPKKTRIVKTVALCLISIAISLFATETKQSVDSNAYSHGSLMCLQGIEGPGVRLMLTRKKCEGGLAYPRLEIDIREQPVPVHKRIVIGPENGAFECLDPKESCEQFLSGELVFDHFESRSGNVEITDGYYELKLRTKIERGHFEVDCYGTCG